MAGAVLLFAVLLIAAPAVVHAGVSPTLSGDSEALEAAESLSAAGVITDWDPAEGALHGYVTRGQLAMMLARALGLADSAAGHFTDVTSRDRCFGAVNALQEAGLVTGVTATTFASDELISRQRAVSWVMAALGHKVAREGSSLVPFRLTYFDRADAWLAGFSDRPLVRAEFARSVANAYRLKIIDAFADGWFYPTLPLSWGDAVIMVDRALRRAPMMRATYPKAVAARWSYPQQRVNSKGPLVWYLEYRLTSLKYSPGTVDGVYDYHTRDAVMAFQKVERLKRTGTAGDVTWQRLPGAQTPAPKLADVGTRIEVDLTRQVLFMITDNQVWKIVHVSTGRQGTRTGHFQIKEKYKGRVSCVTVDGVMYYPSYVVSKTAIHGYPSVPSYPASHGCVRVPMWMAEELWYDTPTGMTIDIYYNNKG